jgi:hypothetical protein
MSVIVWHGLRCTELRAIVLIDGTSQNHELQDDLLQQTLKKSFLVLAIACTTQHKTVSLGEVV